MKLIDGKLLAEKIKDKIALDIHNLAGPRPGLAIILVGERPDSTLYVNLKEKQAGAVGIDTHVYRCPESISQEELLKTIEFLNNDNEVDAILVQLPLPAQLDTDTIVNAVKADKDIDGFTMENMRRLMGGSDEVGLMPPVYAVIIAMLESINCEIANKKINLIVNSDIFEEHLVEILKLQGAIITDNIKEADIIITAQGKAKAIHSQIVKDNAVIIDIGISHDKDGKVVGDVDAESMKDKPGYLSPVPGGVGPMTIAMAFLNTLITFKKQKNL
ncbi:MAG: bifunctional 5,10-methylenetetrahydrofolate dehydrogenase/5,10-methenyltetrahydrofolate cyclohydrolase [Candidatus Falkowbacteria bacterium]|nr:bifunctional 5,10-methylenetetrahydrofolate dehydrogenase/5,10-methenyltetrahydrofolate cyclohydrolase [Candidatus Falkowbacteria bacterium]